MGIEKLEISANSENEAKYFLKNIMMLQDVKSYYIFKVLFKRGQ